ncbi:MAG: glycosyltransferase family 2 protein [Clostridia bacterium]|nr:glycosyltransferase family 2 protein [Clostridia bacterium]
MVTVLLATYNGSKYIREQIDSLLSQTYKDFNILVHDDGSSDDTLGIIDDYITKYPDKISRIDAPPTGSPQGNFSLLFSKCESDYILFCDQDDIWKPTKIEKDITAIIKAEEEYGKDTPILLHSDLTVANENGQTVYRSFFRQQGFDNGYITLPHLLVKNYVTGCTVAVNKALKDRSGEIPKECPMHDWWMALVACVFGKIIFIDEPLVYYRQHGDNEVGARHSKGFGYVAEKIKNLSRVKSDYLSTYIQARMFRQRFINDLDSDSQKIINAYCNMSELSKMGRIRLLRRYDFKKNSKLKVLGQYLIV